jgi:hypothetical protein
MIPKVTAMIGNSSEMGSLELMGADDFFVTIHHVPMRNTAPHKK